VVKIAWPSSWNRRSGRMSARARHSDSTRVLQNDEANTAIERGALDGWEMPRFTHILDNRLPDICEFPASRIDHALLQKDSWCSFLLEVESTPGLSWEWKGYYSEGMQKVRMGRTCWSHGCEVEWRF
jgi:hypothetical protein